MKFKLWLEQGQGPVNLYHGAPTGSNNENIEGFRGGVEPEMSQGGHGQGSGFYVWTDKQSAVKHAGSFDAGVGNPMVITIQAVLNPTEWDIDAEIGGGTHIIEFIRNNFGIFQQLDDIDIPSANLIIHPAKTKLLPSAIKLKLTRAGFSITKVFNQNTGGLQAGEIFGQIWNALQQKYPDVTNKAKEQMLSQAAQTPGRALKYIGQRTLPVAQIEVLQDGQWVPA